MSVKEITGDIVRDGQGIICHQVNYQGVMGGGVAASIRERLLSDAQYREYQLYCRTKRSSALGSVLYSRLKRSSVVANMFCQNAEPSQEGDFTNYGYMEKCFQDIRRHAESWNYPVYIPGYIGCGIAGGDWVKVKWIIEQVFRNANVPVTIVYWEKERTFLDDEDELPFN